MLICIFCCVSSVDSFLVEKYPPPFSADLNGGVDFPPPHHRVHVDCGPAGRSSCGSHGCCSSSHMPLLSPHRRFRSTWGALPGPTGMSPSCSWTSLVGDVEFWTCDVPDVSATLPFSSCGTSSSETSQIIPPPIGFTSMSKQVQPQVGGPSNLLYHNKKGCEGRRFYKAELPISLKPI